MMRTDDFETAVREGTEAAGRTTARNLTRCSPEAAHIWAALATCQSKREGVPIDVIANRLALDVTAVRAHAVVLHALRLVDFVGEHGLSHCGVWTADVEKVLGGDAGSALWPHWDYGYDHRQVLVARGDV